MVTLGNLLNILKNENVSIISTRRCLLAAGCTKELKDQLATFLNKEVKRAYVVDECRAESISVYGDLSDIGSCKQYNDKSLFSGEIKAKVKVTKKSHINIIIDLKEKFR